MAGAAAWHAPADRGRDWGGEGVAAVGVGRGDAPADGSGPGRGASPPKRLESSGRAIFDTDGPGCPDPDAIADMLEAAVADMQGRAARFAGMRRDHTPTVDEPFVVLLVDEAAFLTAYQRDRKLKERIMAALATLTTQGRAVGYCVVAALEDPRKDVLTIRNLFPDRIAMRLDEPEQTDMVLGDGARDRGADLRTDLH